MKCIAYPSQIWKSASASPAFQRYKIYLIYVLSITRVSALQVSCGRRHILPIPIRS